MVMKIGLNTTALLSPKSGIGQYVQQLSRRLYANPLLDIAFFCGLKWTPEPLPGDGVTKTFQKYAALNSRTAGIPGLQKAIKKLKEHLRQTAFSVGSSSQGIDLYHEPNFIPFKSDKPIVITVHDMSPFRLAHHHKKELVKLFKDKLPTAVDRATAIIVDSQFVKDEVIDYFPEVANKVFPVHLAAGPEFQPHSFDGCAKFLASSDLTYQRYILAVGTLEPRKNLISVIRAYVQLPESLRKVYPLVIAGMKGWHHDDFESAAEALISKGQIRMLGYVPDEDLPRLYSGATLMVYPSIYEGFGLPPLEAMACGTPVITSNVASLPEVVGAAGITLAPKDIEGLADAINLIVSDSDFARQLSAKGLLQAKCFSWEKTADQTVAIYRQVLGL